MKVVFVTRDGLECPAVIPDDMPPVIRRPMRCHPKWNEKDWEKNTISLREYRWNGKRNPDGARVYVEEIQ